jgi:diketogulonate reductase-like aldo/keto reductase
LWRVRARAASARSPRYGFWVLTRKIPRTGEELPVIGLGTWQTFDVPPRGHEPLKEVLTAYFAAGGRLIDSSPMYGRSEETVGDLRGDAPAFLATKVWTSGKQAGIDQMRRSMQRMRTDRMDLMQIHNLLDYRTHLPVLRDWKAAGTIRYLGVTHYQHSAFDTIEKLMREEQLDFIQVPYSITDTLAEERLLPLAEETGTAVIAMTPFESGALFRKVRGKQLPQWAAESGITSWAQFFLAWILGHPAITCPIPATASAAHLADFMRAGPGPLPDAKVRGKMRAAVEAT